MLNHQQRKKLLSYFFINLILTPGILSFNETNAQTYRTEYKVLQTIHSESKLNLEYVGVAIVSPSMYLYTQKTKPEFLKDELRMHAGNGEIIIYRPNPDSISKIFYRAFDSSIIRFKISNNIDDVEYYMQEQIGNSIQIKLIEESRIIKGFYCKKALFYHPSNPKIEVATAWYCPEIKIMAGPADLSGLPGLIIEAEHFQTREIYSLIRFRDITQEGVNDFWPEQFNGISFFKLTKIESNNR